MDSSLAKSLETFKKRAISQPTVEKKKREAPSDSHNRDGKRPKLPTAAAAVSAPKMEINSYKSMGGSSQYKFGVLARIVKHMRKRHQVGDDHPLTLDDILDETNQLDVGSKVKQWLGTEALVNNPKIEITSDGSRYVFKAPYKLRDKKSLLKLLKHHDLKGMGGILLEDVQESLPHCEKALKVLNNEILYISRPMDKKKVLFYNDRTANFGVDEEFQKQWRAVAVESMDDAKIEEYLEKQGIRSMQDHGIKKQMNPIKRKKAGKRKSHKPRDNEHLAHVLETYDDQK